MPFCAQCGSSVDGRFCQKCGGAVAADQPISSTPLAGSGAGAVPVASAGLAENAASALCYLAGLITGIIFLVIPPYNQNPRIRFHAFQSIFFHVGWIAAWFVIVAIGMFLPLSISLLLSLFSLLLWCGGLIVWLLLMWKAYQGQTFSLPIIGPIARQQAGK